MSDGPKRSDTNRDSDGQPPVSRREFVAGSMAFGTAATAGCIEGEVGADETTQNDEQTPRQRDTVLVFNTGDGSVSVVDAETNDAVETTDIGLSSSFPSNQYTPFLVDEASDNLWVNVDRGVRALRADDLRETARVDTGSGANWQELTPDGLHLVVSAREPAHTQYKIDVDRESDSFGAVVGEIDRTDEGGRDDRDGPGPCDVTIHPDGEYAYVPDLYGDTLTVIDVESFAVETQVDVDPLADGEPPEPWMATVDRDGEQLLVEHSSGIETIWDVSDPAAPVELARLTSDDDLGDGPLTSEISVNGATGYVFTPGTRDVTVIDMRTREVSDRIDLGGQAFTGTWDPAHEQLYVPVQTEDVVQVIEDDSREVVATLDVGANPYGATAATVRPDPTPTTGTTDTAGRLVDDNPGTTYCIENCACGHEL